MCVRSTQARQSRRGQTMVTRTAQALLKRHLLLITGLCLQGCRLHGTASSESLRECINSIENILVEISYLSSKTLP